MSSSEPIDKPAAHKHFATACFNEAWDLIDKKDRTESDNEQMIALNQASIYHWTQLPDCDDQRLSIGYWQASRIRALVGHAAEALRLARVCLSYSENLSPFYLGYAYEAMARASRLLGDEPAHALHLETARTLALKITDPDERSMLDTDLQTL